MSLSSAPLSYHHHLHKLKVTASCLSQLHSNAVTLARVVYFHKDWKNHVCHCIDLRDELEIRGVDGSNLSIFKCLYIVFYWFPTSTITWIIRKMCIGSSGSSHGVGKDKAVSWEQANWNDYARCWMKQRRVMNALYCIPKIIVWSTVEHWKVRYEKSRSCWKIFKIDHDSYEIANHENNDCCQSMMLWIQLSIGSNRSLKVFMINLLVERPWRGAPFRDFWSFVRYGAPC